MEDDDLYPPLESLSEDFTHFEIIGMGKFGQVYRVTSNKTGNIFVSFWSIVHIILVSFKQKLFRKFFLLTNIHSLHFLKKNILAMSSLFRSGFRGETHPVSAAKRAEAGLGRSGHSQVRQIPDFRTIPGKRWRQS
jgi:hypothetical protein